MSFSFVAHPRQPFPRWMGPYSPARGRYSGFRFHGKQLGTWVEETGARAFWPATQSAGAQAIQDLVLGRWGGGRVLFLPDGLVVKPLPQPGPISNDELVSRVVIGRCSGTLALVGPDGLRLDMAQPGSLAPGAPWPGPPTTGLECIIQSDGSLDCTWYHPTHLGRDEFRETICGADAKLFAGFQRARPGDAGGRVRITLHGHVITNRETAAGWRSFYVGQINPKALLGNWKKWIKEDKP